MCAKDVNAKDSHGCAVQSRNAHVHGSFGTLLGALTLMTLPPLFVMIVWYTCAHLDGSVAMLWQQCWVKGVAQMLTVVWPKPTATAWKIVSTYAAIQAGLMAFLPGKTFIGTVDPSGYRPVYRANGFQSFAVSVALFFVGAHVGWFNPSIVYDNFGEIMSALNRAAILVCILLYLKGTFFPSQGDHSSSGSAIVDMYWGLELYPLIGGFPVKAFIAGRFGMMAWTLLPLCFAYKQMETFGAVSDTMLVATILNVAYCGKFYYWETGYWSSMDMQHDRAGFYICWGCLVWVPGLYMSPMLFLVNHPTTIGLVAASTALLAGLAMIIINYDSDLQRQRFRGSNGDCIIWGAPPVTINAVYTDQAGKLHKSILLASGWWGVSRHFHYLPEIAFSFIAASMGMFNHALPYFYPIFLTLLLLDRAKRDDVRCKNKYGKSWTEYQILVPYMVLPGVL